MYSTAASPRGRPPVFRLSQTRAGSGRISARTNKGEQCWMVLNSAFKFQNLIRVLERLIQKASGKVPDLE